MSKFIITGPKTLTGEFKVNGSKNAATPIIAACLLVKHPCVLDNVPRVSDVYKMLDLLMSLGAQIQWTGDHQVTINTEPTTLQNLNDQLIKTMRSSVLLIGPLLSRFGGVELPEPGGCFLGNRPLDTHLAILQQFGANINSQKDEQGKTNLKITLDKLNGAAITLPEFSVTATENAIMLAVLADGNTTIKLAAQEPHVQDLIKFLNSTGAQIKIEPNNQITVNGVQKLNGTTHKIIPDMLEAGTMAVAGTLLGDELTICDLDVNHLDIVLLKLKEIGADITVGQTGECTWSLKIKRSHNLKPFKVQALPYPGFPTDLQEPFSLLATQCQGASLIHDPLFEDRMRHIPELVRMGASALVCDPHRSIITGPTPLSSYELKSPNIRGGGMFVIAGLVADGETMINDVENTIDRGYERLEVRLNELGAGIKRIEE